MIVNLYNIHTIFFQDLTNEVSQTRNDHDKLVNEKKVLERKNAKLSHETSNESCTKAECQAKLDERIRDYENLSLKHANLLVSKKELEDELMAKISSIEVADELSGVKFELKRLHTILAEKEKELVTAKLQQEGSSIFCTSWT